jgi:hypothetical protein
MKTGRLRQAYFPVLLDNVSDLKKSGYRSHNYQEAEALSIK